VPAIVGRLRACRPRHLREACHVDGDPPGLDLGHRMAEGSRRFPPPWHAAKIPGGYVVRDANWQPIAYVYSRENEAEARQAKVLTKDKARRIAINIARLPALLGKG
jgi:hypothetical protein